MSGEEEEHAHSAVSATSISVGDRDGHHIWGEAEPLWTTETESVDGSCVDSGVSLTAPAQKDGEPSAKKKLPKKLQQHLRKVVFHQESASNPESSQNGESSHQGDDELSTTRRLGEVRGLGEDEEEEEQEEFEPDTVGEGNDLEHMSQSLAHQGKRKAAYSKGSALHQSGQCKPCFYAQSKMGCLNGSDCKFCHLLHPKKNRPRPCKSKRTQCKQLVGILYSVFGEDSQQFQEASQRLASESAYMRSILGAHKRDNRASGSDELLSYAGGSVDVPLRPMLAADGSVDFGGLPASSSYSNGAI